MTRTEILLKMSEMPARRLFHTMELGGSMAQLSKMEAEGLISSQRRRRTGRHRDWFLSERQHGAFAFLFDEPAQPVFGR